MPVKIRLQRRGRKKSPFYHIVIADARAPRDGKFIENIGVYDPMTKPATIEVDRDKAYEWLEKGAQPTDTVRAILRFKGVMYKKHLMGGVAKGALTEEQALAKWTAWVEEKEAKIKKRRDETEAEKNAFRAAVSGTVPKIVIKKEEEPEVESEGVEAGEEATEASQTQVTAEVKPEAAEVAEQPAAVAKAEEEVKEPEAVVEKEAQPSPEKKEAEPVAEVVEDKKEPSPKAVETESEVPETKESTEAKPEEVKAEAATEVVETKEEVKPEEPAEEEAKDTDKEAK